jgi:hypothetical protein
MSLPVPYAAERHTVALGELGREVPEEMQRRYAMHAADTRPRVYDRLTDNWLALTVRFIVRDCGIREVKDRMSGEVLRELDEAGIGVASATLAIVRLPPPRLHDEANR